MPFAPFAGPDTAYNNEWLVPFAKRFKSQAQQISQHYYAEGPPTDPSMTIDRLLRPNPKSGEMNSRGCKSYHAGIRAAFPLGGNQFLLFGR